MVEGGDPVVAGGEAPQGTVRVEVIDDRGDVHRAEVRDGAWRVVLGGAGFSEPLVRHLDADGDIVSLPLPPGERHALAVAEPCPVCGESAWEELVGAQPPQAVCARCGFREEGPWMFDAFALPVEAEEEPVDEPGAGAWDRELAEALAGLAMPVYAVAGRPAAIVGFGGSETETRSVDVGHTGRDEARLLIVQTERDRPSRDPRRRLADLVTRYDHGAAESAAAFAVVHNAREREARRAVAAAAVETRVIAIDGEPEEFGVIAAGDAWVAAREHYGVSVTVVARGVPPDDLVLERLIDPLDPGAGTSAAATGRVRSRRRAEAGELPPRADVEALIARHGLGEHAEAILSALEAGYRLVPGGDGRTRIGGLPDLADGEAWPHAPDGIPYTFLAQVDCSALPRLDEAWSSPLPWAHEGALVRIFADLDTRVPDGGPAVALACAADAGVRRAALPPRPDPLPADAFEPDDESMRFLPETPVLPRPSLTLPAVWLVIGDLEWDDPLRDAYRRLADELGGDARGPQLLGQTETVQGEDPRSYGHLEHPGVAELQPADAWRVLINLVEAHGMEFWDAGALAIVAPVADLAAGRHDRCVSVPSMG